MLLGARLKRVRSVDVVGAVARLYLVENHVKIPILRTQIITLNFHSKHKVFFCRSDNFAEPRDSFSLLVVCKANDSSVDCVDDHARECDGDCDDNSNRNQSPREGSVLSFFLKPKHLKRVEEIRHFQYFF